MKNKLSIIFFGVIFIAFFGAKLQRLKPLNFDCLIINDVQIINNETDQFENFAHLVVRQGVIHALLKEQNQELLKDNCSFLDGKNSFALPGLIDAHTHLLAGDNQPVNSWQEALELSALRPKMSRLLRAEENANSMLKLGFTTVRDLGNSGFFLDEKLKQLLLQKNSHGPDIIYSGPGLAVAPSQINLKLNPDEYRLINNDTDFNSLFKLYSNRGALWIKLYADNSNNISQLQPDLAKKVISAAHQAGIKVSLHAENEASELLALAVIPDSIEHFYPPPQLENINPESLTSYVVLTDQSLRACENLTFIPNCSARIEHYKMRVQWLKQQGFHLVFGSDALLDYSTKIQNRGLAALDSLLTLQSFGLSPLEIINAATKEAAQMLDLNTGQIAEGKEADLVLYNKNPLLELAALKSPNLVISNGYVICKKETECQQ